MTKIWSIIGLTLTAVPACAMDTLGDEGVEGAESAVTIESETDQSALFEPIGNGFDSCLDREICFYTGKGRNRQEVQLDCARR